ncbi:hypothetical protein O181_007272 [Austropuccinia psidii MF-1]|uniref:Uncharacterized protein n=1 Tax=Austropuccinia psidii MF-1 TaxID=1389203 RepID=A0A9Q3BLL1_9BASI|nr:hypothetical protein [Austropuccinia psidii MF-1]
MEEITPILQHFQDFLTGKVPFDQFPKSQEDDQYYADPLECNNSHGRPQGARNQNKNPNKREPSIFQIIGSQSKRRGRPPLKSDQYNNIKITVKHPLSNYGSGII